MIKPFPLLFADPSLRAGDFSRFSNSYAEILKNHLPTAQRVDFVRNAADLTNIFDKQAVLHELTDLFHRLKDNDEMIGVHPECLMLQFGVKGGESVVAVITGADRVFLRKVSEDWLSEERLRVEREFLLLKEARVDMQTGLLNGSNLCYLLDTYSVSQRFHLILVELPPKRNSFQYALRHAQKCATALLDFFQSDTVPHYLGQCTFALVLQDNPAEGKGEVEAALVAYLKREGFARIHIGSSCFGYGVEDSDGRNGRRLLDESWTALRHAAKRGPCSFCDYRLLASPESHPLRPLDKRQMSRLGRFWRNAESFSLVRFQSTGELPAQMLRAHLDRGQVIVEESDVLVYLAGTEPQEALAWAIQCMRQVTDPALRRELSAGIAGYPFADFKKQEIPANCRKAVLHAAFYEEPRAAVFDSVSMNISGDIYIGDGDLAKAVREYQRGLKCDERNVNLHNSLGVALAMMGKLGPAMQSFEGALALDGENFMALYNLGLAEQSRGHKEGAFAYFKRALTCCLEQTNGEADLVDDLQLQLGILAGDLRQHATSLEYLLPWSRKNARQQRSGRVLFHLGRAYHGVGQNRKAMATLQKALQFNEFDDRAMNLLGTVYLQEGEGDDIALDLCRKSVELEPANLVYRLHLAEVQLRCRMIREARENLYRCLRNRKLKAQAQLLLANSYLQEEKPEKAKAWLAKRSAQEQGQPPPPEHASPVSQEFSLEDTGR